MVFRDRADAARRLAARLTHYRGRAPLVLAIPRGAVPMAGIIASELGGEMDVVLVHKLGAPGNPEYAIGSVDETGRLLLNDDAGVALADTDYVEHERQAQLAVLQARRRRYTPVRPPLDPAGRVAIVIDDGIATGATMAAALRAVRAADPAVLVAAVPVAAPEALQRIRREADEVICLEAPESFFAVGQFFEQFEQVSDEEVMELLRSGTG